MCRNIRTLSHFEPPASPAEVQAAARQYVRKVSGTTSQANEPAVERAVDAVAVATRELLDELVFSSAPRDRDIEAAKARERSARRFSSPTPPV
ncbi:DUF2277 domain-containing protein [soil metagenome]